MCFFWNGVWFNNTINNNALATGDMSGLVNLAYSLVGSRYVSGGADPYWNS